MFTLIVSSCAPGRGREVQNPPPAKKPSSLSQGSAVEITGANYEEVRSESVVLLLFWAEWSASDRALMPTIAAISKEYAGKAVIGKVNVDDNPELANKFGIKGIPTLVVLKDGSEQERVVGLVTKKKINELLDKQLN